MYIMPNISNSKARLATKNEQLKGCSTANISAVTPVALRRHPFSPRVQAELLAYEYPQPLVFQTRLCNNKDTSKPTHRKWVILKHEYLLCITRVRDAAAYETNME